MTVRLADVLTVLENMFPLAWAESWDRVGLVAGDPTWEIHQVRLAVDPTVAEAHAAATHPGTLLLTHHPLLLKGESFLSTESGKGAVITALLRSSSALWCGHTNSDRSRAGTVGAWIGALDLRNSRPLVEPATRHGRADGDQNPTAPTTELFGLGAVGDLPHPMTVGSLASAIAQHVPATAQGVLFTGSWEREVHSIAVCPGAGDSFLEEATAAGVDAYITSDLRHHTALEHLESRADHSAVPALLDLPHYASEFLYLPNLADALREQFPSLTVEVSDMSSDPFSGVAR